MKRRILNILKLILPTLAVGISILLYYMLEDNGKQKAAAHPYYIYFMLLFGTIYLLIVLISIFHKNLLIKVLYKAPFYTGIILVVNIINLVTTKTLWLPTIYFPSLDRIFGMIVEDRIFLIGNVFDSLKLLLTGFICGATVGFVTGVALGYNEKVSYWITPITKVIGPMPTTAWIPLALSVFATTHGANVFLIAFAVWFPITLMTSSGIQSTSKVYFEISSTLGASTVFKVLRVAIPSAMPSIFMGIFYGTVNSFVTLMAVEMNGNSSGIGWYINWMKQVMMYDGVYTGLILIAIMCSTILTILFKVRDKVLVWQKGVIKW